MVHQFKQDTEDNFDRIRAKQVREEANLGLEDLARRLNQDHKPTVKFYARTIGSFEEGYRIPFPSGESRWKTANEYLYWLAGRGYDPYGLNLDLEPIEIIV
ncbi:MAG: hypothetical protein AABW89_03830 [Nanoarchaeota archaeon]